MTRFSSCVALLLLFGCGEPKAPVAPPAAPPAPVVEASFGEATKQFLAAISAFEAHVWDANGTERRKAVNVLAEAGGKLVASPGHCKDLPVEALRRATARVVAEARAFSNKMNAEEARGKPLDQGLPWPYDYKEAVALQRCLLIEAQPGSFDKHQTFARMAATVGVLEVLSKDGPIDDERAALTELYIICNGSFANHKDLTHVEKELIRAVIDSRYEVNGTMPTELRLRELRQKLVELAKGA